MKAQTCLLLLTLLTLFSFSLQSVDKPIKYYPDFPEQKDSIQRICLLGDFMLLKDRGEINLSDNIEWWNGFVDVFSEKLQEKNYTLKKTVLTSIGMLADPELTLEDIEEKVVRKAPFYMNETVSADPEYKKALSSLYRKLDKHDSEKATLKIQPELLQKLGLSGFDTLFVVHQYGLVDGGGALGLVTPFASALNGSGIGHFFYIIDLRSGAVIWSYKNFIGGGAPWNMHKIVNSYAKVFVKSLPEKS